MAAILKAKGASLLKGKDKTSLFLRLCECGADKPASSASFKRGEKLEVLSWEDI